MCVGVCDTILWLYWTSFELMWKVSISECYLRFNWNNKEDTYDYTNWISRQYWNICQAFSYHCEYCTDIASKSETVIIIFKYQGKIVLILFLNLAVDAHSSNLVHRTFSLIVLKRKFDNFLLKMCFFLGKRLEYCANIAPKSETINTLFKY